MEVANGILCEPGEGLARHRCVIHVMTPCGQVCRRYLSTINSAPRLSLTGKRRLSKTVTANSLPEQESFPMGSVFIDSTIADDARRKRLYAGDIFILSATDGTRSLIELARRMLSEAFAPHDPRTIHEEKTPEE